MASRLKILMASGSKKGTQIHFSFLSKVPANEPPPGSPTGSLWRGRPIYRAFLHISQKPHLLGSPVKEPSVKVPLTEFLAEMPHHYSNPSFIYQVPGIRAPPHIPGSPRMERGPHGERCLYLETFSNTSSRVPSEGSPLHGASYE